MIELHRYRLPFKDSFRTATQVFDHREGLLLTFVGSEGSWLSEISPLPGFSSETLDQVLSELIPILPVLNDFFRSGFSRTELMGFLTSLPDSPSLQCGISYLGIQLLAGRTGNSPAKILSNSPSQTVHINGVAGVNKLDVLLESMRDLAGLGFNTLKVKAPWPIGDLADHLNTLQSAYPELQFRLDANRSWPEDALREAESLLGRLNIEYVEEPFSTSSPEQFHAISYGSTLPIAADESASTLSDFSEFLKLSSDSFLVLKPMLTGNLLAISEQIARSRPKKKGIVITTALESAIGREMCLIAAAALGDPTLCHGLNTGPLFKSDLFYDERTNKPLLSLPEVVKTLAVFETVNRNQTEHIATWPE